MGIWLKPHSLFREWKETRHNELSTSSLSSKMSCLLIQLCQSDQLYHPLESHSSPARNDGYVTSHGCNELHFLDRSNLTNEGSQGVFLSEGQVLLHSTTCLYLDWAISQHNYLHPSCLRAVELACANLQRVSNVGNCWDKSVLKTDI